MEGCGGERKKEGGVDLTGVGKSCLCLLNILGQNVVRISIYKLIVHSGTHHALHAPRVSLREYSQTSAYLPFPFSSPTP